MNRTSIDKTVWICTYSSEADEIISNLKSEDKKFAEEFFYGTDIQGCNVSRIRTNINKILKKSYDLELSVQEFGSTIYRILLGNNNWSMLNKYSYKGTLFAWLERISLHEIVKELKLTKEIRQESAPTLGNLRLAGRSVSADIWQAAIDEHLWEKDLHAFMEAWMVTRLSKERIMEEMGFNEEAFKQTYKRVAKKLIYRFVNTDCPYGQIILREKVKRKKFVSEDYTDDSCVMLNLHETRNPFTDIFGVNLTPEELNCKITNFLHHFHEKLKWNTNDIRLWELRYIKDRESVLVAKDLGKTTTWVYRRFSHLKCEFNKEMGRWWRNVA